MSDTDLGRQSSERAAQAMDWARVFTEESFTQGKRTLDALMGITRKMAADWDGQANTAREQTMALTEKTLSNTMDFGRKLAKVKDPQDFARCQSDYLATQAQTIADGTKEFGERMQQAANNFAQNAATAMSETNRRGHEAVTNIGSRTEQTSRRQQRSE